MELNKIYNEDCLVGMKKIPSKAIDLIVSDPPYIIDNSGGGIYAHDDKGYVKELDEIKSGFDLRILDECCRVMKKINIYLWCSQKQIPLYLDYFVKKKGCNWNLITWHKTNPIPACGNKYITDTEYCLFFREKGVRIYGDTSTKGTYFITPLNTSEKNLWNHPTIKPTPFFQKHIINSSLKGDTVLDPFMGSGTTAIACIKEKRNFIGFELNKEYYDKACKRIKLELAQPSLF